tara:strand:+ start:195 stop:464 length:270 start_codon:yes stop_codon:yes gene_type:complete
MKCETDKTLESHPIKTSDKLIPGDFVQIKDGLICHYTFDYNKTSVSDALLSKNPNRGILIKINDDGTALVNFPNKNNDSGNLITVQDYY